MIFEVDTYIREWIFVKWRIDVGWLLIITIADSYN